MKRTYMPLACTVLLVLALAAVGQALDLDKLKYPKLNELRPPEVERVTMANGIRLYLSPDHRMPIFEASVRINCGSYLDPPEKVGLASICGTVLRTGGTSKWTGDEIDEALEGIGGYVETNIGTTVGSASVNVLSEYTDLGLEVLAEILQRPVFDQDKLDLAKVQARSAISRRNDEPMQIAIREFRKAVYGPESPYARHTEYATLDAIEHQDLVDFHAAYFKPQNIQMAFWGDFDRDELVAKLEKYFGGWTREGDPVPPPPDVDYKFDRRVFYAEKTDVNQTNILLGHIGGRRTDEDYPARIVMNNVFGGGFASRLFNAVRSREGLAYAAFGVYTARFSYPGMFYAFASTKSETTAKAIRETIKVIEQMQIDPPTDDEMAAGKDGYLNSFVFNFDQKSEVVNRLMAFDFYGVSQNLLFDEKKEVEKVDADAVLAAAKKNLRPDALRIMVVGKGEDFEMPLDQLGLGPVDTVDITIPTGEEEKELIITEETLAKGKEVLDLAVEAHGGLAAYKNVASVSRNGTLTISTPSGAKIPLSVESIDVFPDKSRSVVSVMGTKMYKIRDGNTGWKTDQMTRQVVAMTEDDLVDNDKEKARSTLRIFRASDDPYYQAVYDGSGTVNGTAVEYVVILDTEGNNICRLGIDRGSHVLVSKSYWSETPAGDGTIEEVIGSLSDVSGIKVAMQTVSSMNGQEIMQFDIAEYVINGDVPADAFSKPE